MTTVLLKVRSTAYWGNGNMNLTGLYCNCMAGLHRFPFLVRHLHLSTRVAQFPHVYVDKLNTIAGGTLISSAISFNIFGEIPSTPGDLSLSSF